MIDILPRAPEAGTEFRVAWWYRQLFFHTWAQLSYSCCPTLILNQGCKSSNDSMIANKWTAKQERLHMNLEGIQSSNITTWKGLPRINIPVPLLQQYFVYLQIWEICAENKVDVWPENKPFYFIYLFKNLRWKSFRIVSLMNRFAVLSSPRAWFLKMTSSSHL